MKVVYLAGAFRGSTAWEVECNVRRAEEVGHAVLKAGAMPLIPHANTRFFHGECEDQFLVDGTLELMRRCDAVLRVPGWENSVGTRGELHEASRLRMPVLHTMEELHEWLAHHRESQTPT
jgi:hypothetical protein